MEKNEKMMILEMLQNGKINAEEAARLLSAAETNAAQPQAPQTSPGTSARASAPAPKTGPVYSPAYGPNNGPAPREARGGAATPASGSFSDELSRKFDTFIKDIEPKVQKLTETVAEKTVRAADRISKAFSSPASDVSARPVAAPAQGAFYTPAAGAVKSVSAAPPVGSGAVESNIEIRVGSANSELNLTGFNGSVMVKGYNGDKITARLTTRPKRPGARAELMTLGNKYFLNYDENDFNEVSIDAYVPETMFYVVKISSANGQINAQTLKTSFLEADNVNGGIEISGVTAENVKIDAQNGDVRLTGVTAQNGSAESFNGNLSASGLDISKLSLSTFNGALNLNMTGFKNFNDYTWSVESSNGKTTLFLPSAPDVGYHIKARAALGDIKIGLTGISYIANEKSYAEAKSFNYDAARVRAKLALETSNASLVVN